MLPKVPIPTLTQTMAEYLRVLQPIVTPQQLERSRSVIKQFTAPNGPGATLQRHLLDKREAEDNWAYYYWLNDMYMDNPLPLPINSNPGMVLPPRKFTTVNDIARFAARLIDNLMLHKEMLDSGGLVQERATSREKGQPLCMAQYYRLLGSCRRPGEIRDSQYLPQQRSDEHMIICCRNQMYCVPVKAGDRGRLTEDEIASQVLCALNDAPCLRYDPPRVGILTTGTRPQWAKDRQLLLLEPQNVRNIELVEQALALICFDESIPLTFNARGFNGSPAGAHYCAGRDESNMAHEMIHGGGSKYNTGNRWFDKTMQLIICNDGSWGLCYEHSPSEGIAVVQLLEGIVKKIDEMPSREENGSQNYLPPPERLEWSICPEIEQRISEASRDADRNIEDLDFYVYRYRSYGKNFIKACQVSPDVFIQLALQLAYFKLYGHLVSTYESASTRRFMLGRVDCIRSASMEALEWAKAMCQGEGANVTLESDKEDDYSCEGNDIKKRDHLRELFRCAAARQTEVMVQNILGHGIDIHLLGLREACREKEGNMHELFTDESYKIANCFLLSTSQVACSTNSFMGYGPVTPHGYGASYNPHPNEIIFCISAFFSSDKTSASRFARSLQDSLDAMRDLLS
ncbi:choline O-acetyltransferase isoform X2 [Toxorhynchites rutilus septentrionalis]|uniref:choline O-acetyltransferase isoform X2 n=1 Tax=Toxorhynchites rutilus septentrionalis TaxID=329112 RepID=UPI00247857C9|nr:choline O-acetyltransferase isoform X2 [Toxorhynchites rutilus septentrionalis]